MKRRGNGRFSSRDFTGAYALLVSLLIGVTLQNYERIRSYLNPEMVNPYVSHNFYAETTPGTWRQAEIVPLDQLSERLGGEMVAEAVEQPKTGKEYIISLIHQIFGNKAEEALKIATCESGLNPTRQGDKHIMGELNGEVVGDSIGLFQIRTGDAGVYDKRPWNRAKANGMTADEFRAKLKDPKYNIEYAKKMYDRKGSWSDWFNCMRKTGV